MVTDPNIILSGNRMAQPQLPDVNAMMQTRTAGLENIYNMEQQRAEQARTAQKEQEAAQEAATLKALLPAYTYGIQTGDIAGAGNLVPPEMRPQIQQYIDALTGKSPQEVQAALIGSLSSSQAGQEALAAIQRAAAVDVQRGHLEVSRAELAQRRAEAERGPEPLYKEIVLEDGTLALYDTKSGRIIQPSLEGPIGTELPPGEAAKPLKVKQKDGATAEEVKKRLADEKRVKDLGLAVSEIERAMTPGGLIDTATGSYLGNLFDTAAAAFTFGTEGAQAIARLAPIADLALKIVPRFEGPQSNYDVQSYKDAAGNLANPNVPASTKRAAAEEIVRLFKKYKDQFEYAGDGGGAGGAEDPLGIR